MYKALDAELSRMERHLAGLPPNPHACTLYWYTNEVGAWTHRGKYSIHITQSQIARGSFIATCWFDHWTGQHEYISTTIHADAMRKAEALCTEHNRLQPPYPALLAWPADLDPESLPCHDT